MRKITGVFLCLLFALTFTLNVTAAEVRTEAEAVSINILNNTVEYAPSGYMPVADAGAYSAELRYEVTDNATGERVSLPLVNVGTYTVRAYVLANAVHGGAEAVASFRINPVTAYISVKRQVVAHTAMPNPVKYSVYPSWAEGLVDISVSYRAIRSLGDEGTVVEVPKDMGTYLVRMDVTPKDEKAVCAGKYFVYTIGEKQGELLSDEAALLSVPKSFKSTVETVEREYTGEAAVPDYTVNVAAVESTLRYSRIYADGSNGEYTDNPPVEPGDYIAACFVLDTVIGSSKVVINKIVAKIDMEDKTFTYSPTGVSISQVHTEPQGIELTYNAYKCVDGVAGEGVDFPLTECGTYLISASPSDIYRYSYVDSVSYCYVTIEKQSPIISGQELVAVEDGKFKSVGVSVSPIYSEYSITYYRVEGGGATPLTGAPVDAGEYYALVSVKESDFVKSATAVYGIYIQSNVDENRVFAGYIIKTLCYVFAALGVATAVFHIIWVRVIKRR